MVVPLNASTPASAVYDADSMKFVKDSTGNYLVQDPSTLATPSQTLQHLIQQSTGGANSPYSWNPPSITQATIAPNIDPYGPFSPSWNTGDYSAGLPSSDPRDNPSLVVQAGFHLPVSPGVAVGPNASWNSGDGTFSIKPDIAAGEIGDIGVAVGLSGDSRYSGPSVINIGMGKYLGMQLTPSNVTAWEEKSWYDLARYVNGVSVGFGAGYSAPINVTTDPTYQSPTKK